MSAATKAAVRSVAVLFALLLGLTACGGSGSSTGSGGGGGGSASSAPGGGSASTMMVEIKNFSFNPQQIMVKAGATVTWTNQDSSTHTVTANDKSFDSGDLQQGQMFKHTFDKPGTYPYICTIHEYMNGTVVVQ